MSSSAILKRSWIALGRPGEKVSFDEVAARWGSEGRPYHNAFDYARGKDDRDIVLVSVHFSSSSRTDLPRSQRFPFCTGTCELRSSLHPLPGPPILEGASFLGSLLCV